MWQEAKPLRDSRSFRIVLLAAGALALATGLYGGLQRIGWDQAQNFSFADLHGPLMICGVFGTLISLERAVALRRVWPYAAPILSAAGTLALLLGMPARAGATAYLMASVLLCAANIDIARKQPAVFTATLVLGALSWLAGNVLWLTGSAVSDLVGWWLLFLILTIGGERLEFGRLLPERRGSLPLFLAAALLLIAGAWYGPLSETGKSVFGAALAVTTLWLLRHDVARQTIRFRGLPRFMAVCLLSGYVWLGVTGILLLTEPPGMAAFGYDITLHAILIGFVLSMVFGHALVILPSVAGIRISYSPLLYLPVILLHGSVAMRVAGGLLEMETLRLWSGPATTAAILGFVGVAAAGRLLRARDPCSAATRAL